MRFLPAIFASVALMLSLSGSAGAEGMRCGQRLVSKGDTLHEVRSRCGDPTATDRRVVTRKEKRRVRGPCFKERDGQVKCEHVEEYTVELVIDEWTYDFGPRRFVHYLTFHDGKLHDVTTGSYGRVEAD